jgi:hypothetical protein
MTIASTVLCNLFRFEEATDWQVEDDQHVYTKDKNITIQCLQDGNFSVNQWDDKDNTQTFHKTHNNIDDAIYHAVSL